MQSVRFSLCLCRLVRVEMSNVYGCFRTDNDSSTFFSWIIEANFGRKIFV